MLSTSRHAVTAREWRIAFALAALLMTVTTIPYLLALASQRTDTFGGFLFGAVDGNSYIVKMREGATGDGLFHLIYSSEPEPGVVLFVPYLLAGKVAALVAPVNTPGFVTAALLIFHLARIVCGMAMILASFRFAALFLPAGRMRWLALIVISFGGGFGWLLFMLGIGSWPNSLPIDLYVPEAYSFLMLYGLPHLALGRALLLSGLILISTRQHWGATLATGVAWLVMALSVPYDGVVLYALLGVWGMALTIRHRRLPIRWALRPAVAALFPAPVLLYSLLIVIRNPAFAIYNAQNVLPSPSPVFYGIGFVLPLIPACCGLRWAWRRAKQQPLYALLIVWVISAPILAYVPVSVQRRLIEGIWVPLCILAIAGLRFVIVPALAHSQPLRQHISTRRLWNYALLVTLLLTLPTTGVLLLTGVLGAITHPAQIYHPASEIAALDWLDAHTTPGAVVLSSFETGNYLPARTHVTAFQGHGVETLDAAAKLAAVSAFYNGQLTLAALQTPAEQPIRYVFYGPFEQTLMTDPHALAASDLPQWAQGLTRIYDQGGYAIYAVP